MSRLTRLRARVLLAALVCMQLVGSAAPASAAPTRLDGDDNVATAIAWSRLAFPDDGANTALLGRDDLFADSLASGGAQGQLGAPLLLSDSDELDERTGTELDRLGVDRVVLLGGTGALSPAVADELTDDGYLVERVEGANRVATAVAVADRFLATAGQAILVRAEGDQTAAFADSLAAGALAAAAESPVLLTATEQLSAETEAYLRDSQVTAVLVVGGPAAVSDTVLDQLTQLGVLVQRIAGANRFATAFAASTFTLASSLAAEDAMAAGRIALVDGEDPDSWADGFAAAVLRVPVLLSTGERLPAESVPLFVGADEAGLTTVCGTTVDEVACDRAGIAGSAEVLDVSASRVAFLEPEQPGPGSGIAALLPTADPGAFCYQLIGLGLTAPSTGAQVIAGEDGSAVVELDTTSAGPAVPGFGFAVNCAFDEDPALVGAVFDEPRAYGVRLDTASQPEGALRGPLFPPDRTLLAFLTGDQEAPVPGDPNAFGITQLVTTDRDDEICAFSIVILDQPPTAAHIHEAPPGVPGPIVADLPTPNPDGLGPARCIDGVDPQLVTDIEDDPAAYYVNVHNEPYPDGAVRGQLQDAQELATDGPAADGGGFPGGSFAPALRALTR